MDFDSSRIYEFELWTPGGTRLADISSLARNRVITLERNEAETLTFDMDLDAFETFAEAAGEPDPRILLTPYQIDVKIKRHGQYWLGFQVVALNFNFSEPGSSEGVDRGSSNSVGLSFSVMCKGYLNLFTDRYVTATYSQVEATSIVAELITTTQAQTNGNVGVTIAPDQYETGILRDRTYERANVKRAIQNLTGLVNGRFDFEFTYDKQFKTYSEIGSRRTDIALTYGGNDSNIIGFSMERSALNLYNRLIGQGSGFGEDQLISVQDDTVSQLANYLREGIRQFNSVVEQTTLDDNTAGVLDQTKDLLEIPKITISGKELENIPFLSIGDRVPIRVRNHPLLANIDGYYRIERMIISLDDNDFEKSIRLYFDDFAVGDT